MTPLPATSLNISRWLGVNRRLYVSVAAEEVHFDEASSTSVVDDDGEQGGRRTPPTGIGEPGALVQAHPTGYLERQYHADHQLIATELMDDHFVERGATGASCDEVIEGGKELGAASPLRLVEVAKGVESREDRRAPERPMTYPFGREAASGFSEIPTELWGQGGPEGLCAVGQRRERGHGHRPTANPAWQRFDQRETPLGCPGGPRGGSQDDRANL